MSRSKLLPVLLVAGLLALVIPLAIAFAQADGDVTIRDSDDTEFSNLLSDMAIIDLDLPPLGPDEVYEGWLVTDAGDRPQSTGILVQDENGHVNQTYISANGENLFSVFDKFVISIEPVPDSDPAPSANKPYVRVIPAGGILHIRHLLYSWQGNPPYGADNFHAGTPKGITVGLREQTWVALTHANLSSSSTSIGDVRAHACHVVNIIEGSAGANYDPTCGDPGDGFGVLNYANDTVLHAGLSDTAAAGDPVIGPNSAMVVDSANQTWTLAKQARDRALDAIAAGDLLVAQLHIGNAESSLEKAMGSARSAHWSAQDMGMYTFPIPEVDAPKTGDTSFTVFALGALALGAFLLLTGGLVYRRSRRRA